MLAFFTVVVSDRGLSFLTGEPAQFDIDAVNQAMFLLALVAWISSSIWRNRGGWDRVGVFTFWFIAGFTAASVALDGGLPAYQMLFVAIGLANMAARLHRLRRLQTVDYTADGFQELGAQTSSRPSGRVSHRSAARAINPARVGIGDAVLDPTAQRS